VFLAVVAQFQVALLRKQLHNGTSDYHNFFWQLILGTAHWSKIRHQLLAHWSKIRHQLLGGVNKATSDVLCAPSRRSALQCCEVFMHVRATESLRHLCRATTLVESESSRQQLESDSSRQQLPARLAHRRKPLLEAHWLVRTCRGPRGTPGQCE